MKELAERKSITIMPDLKRVLLQYFDLDKLGKSKNLFQKIDSLSESMVSQLVENIRTEFKDRHRDFENLLQKHFSLAVLRNPQVQSFSEKKKMLIGAYYSNEYSLEAAALMNPSIVMSPENQSKKNNETSIILSLRSVGEGHISSLQFREGSVDDKGSVTIKPVSYHTNAGTYRLITQNNGEITELIYDNSYSISERIIFPMSADERNGIEDARFVKFETGTYYATYTAYDGYNITLKLIQTENFETFYIHKLMDGSFHHKGLALFPRKINGSFVITSRQDGENLYIMYSDDLVSWKQAQKICKPMAPWEFIQLGNCGSPLETDQGWILITHGVGPMRKYVLSACLLDKNDPSKCIGRLGQPLLSPLESERNGYVPNVVYSCGSLIINKEIYIPYAMSDYASGIAAIPVKKLLDHMN